ncbi:nucleotide-binding universal stress UspA family protein [Cupriavidus metallidurans]|jgi:nucleotide-binding universal stress UspA family protein|uniref:universal stress protein n=1 Tax=Cupriavidus TaxID=106589 RepID=UPI00049334F0|nr:universal stress protein [Cupriavidus metallidurans]KWW39199.1 putative universal stress protein [Cupriavidus metallidurans]MDE4920420.1 universal stress protein [Cupriavidus metallidurans]
MHQHILVAVDDSPCARRALNEAVGLASAFHAKLEILHVIDYSFLQYDFGYGDFTELRPQLTAAGESLLKEAGEIAGAAGLEHHETLIDDLATMGNIADRVNGYARTCGADIVVIGTHGRHGLKRMLLGSVAESLARDCPAPVVLVRDDSPARTAERPVAQK